MHAKSRLLSNGMIWHQPGGSSRPSMPFQKIHLSNVILIQNKKLAKLVLI